MFSSFSSIFGPSAPVQSSVPVAEVHGCDTWGLQPSYCMGVRWKVGDPNCRILKVEVQKRGHPTPTSSRPSPALKRTAAGEGDTHAALTLPPTLAEVAAGGRPGPPPDPVFELVPAAVEEAPAVLQPPAQES
jgi:hypothetical protein